MGIDSTAPDKLKPFFLQLIRQSFNQLQMGDGEIADYVATMLADFSHSDRWLMLHDAQGRKLHSVVEMVVAAMGPDGQTRVLGEREVRKYVGDYTLFMSGLFRAFVQKRGFLDYYLEEGKRSYEAVSKLDVSLYRPGFLLFEELSRGFDRASILSRASSCSSKPWSARGFRRTEVVVPRSLSSAGLGDVQDLNSSAPFNVRRKPVGFEASSAIPPPLPHPLALLSLRSYVAWSFRSE